MKILFFGIFILCVIFGFFFAGYLLLEYMEVNKEIKDENWEQVQDIRQKEQLITALNNEIRELRTSKQELADIANEFCESQEAEILKLKKSNNDCLKGLTQCIEGLGGLLNK